MRRTSKKGRRNELYYSLRRLDIFRIHRFLLNFTQPSNANIFPPGRRWLTITWKIGKTIFTEPMTLIHIDWMYVILKKSSTCRHIIALSLKISFSKNVNPYESYLYVSNIINQHDQVDIIYIDFSNTFNRLEYAVTFIMHFSFSLL